jgi:acetyltransferase-like isoleucine patch superfamily enzyme
MEKLNTREPYELLVDCPIHHDTKFGESVRIGENVVIEKDCIIGDHVLIGHNVAVRRGLKIGKYSIIAQLCSLEQDVVIGDYTTIQHQCHLTMGIKVGNYVYFGPMVTTINTRHIRGRRENVELKITPPVIGDGARIGAASVIMPGVTIGVEAVIGANSTVTRDVPDGEIWIGSPARCVGKVPEHEYIDGGIAHG